MCVCTGLLEQGCCWGFITHFHFTEAAQVIPPDPEVTTRLWHDASPLCLKEKQSIRTRPSGRPQCAAYNITAKTTSAFTLRFVTPQRTDKPQALTSKLLRKYNNKTNKQANISTRTALLQKSKEEKRMEESRNTAGSTSGCRARQEGAQITTAYLLHFKRINKIK